MLPSVAYPVRIFPRLVGPLKFFSGFGVCVGVCVIVGVTVGVCVSVGVTVGVCVTVAVGVTVWDGVWVGVGVCDEVGDGVTPAVAFGVPDTV